MTDYGVTDLGFKPMALTEVKADLETAIQSRFSANVNLAPSSVHGQFVAIMSERLTTLWQLGQAVYNANNPVAATGVAVDNILALNGLSRNRARATITAPQPTQTSTGITLYGLVLYGTPGTVVPAGSLISNGQAIPATFALDADATIGAPTNARQSLVFSNAPTSGTYALTFSNASGKSATTGPLTYGMPVADVSLAFGANRTGSYAVTFTQGATTATSEVLDAGASSAQVQTALQKVPGYPNVAVSAINGRLVLHFPDTAVPTVTVSGSAPVSVIGSLQMAVNSLTLADGTTQPFTDCAVSQTTSGYQFDFGLGYLAPNQPASAASTVPLIAVNKSSLVANGNVTNITVLESRVGAPAQAVASATATTTGPNVVLAGALTTIVTPKIGWTGVVNQLDTLTGADVETDEDGLARLAAVRSSQGSGSLASIIEKVRLVPGVSASIGFQNLTNAAQQIRVYQGTPTTGSYQLATDTGVTAAIPYTAAAADIASALAALPNFSQVRVTGTSTYGFVVDFNGAQGGQAQPLLIVLNNSTGVVINAHFGRPPHSVEVVVAGGEDLDVAQAISSALPAGMSSYGAPVVDTLGSVVQGSSQLTLASALGVTNGLTINMPGVPLGAMVASNSGNVITMTAAALSNQTNAPCSLNHAPLLTDSAGNSQLVAFSRPTPTLIYVQIMLTTDRYVSAGDASSGVNAASKWSPLSVATIQKNVLAIGNSIPIGGTIIGQGSNGLVGSFNDVQGVVSYKLTFGTQPNPSNADNIVLQASQAPSFQAENVAITYV